MTFAKTLKFAAAIAVTAATFATASLADHADLPFENIGLIVEAQIKDGKRADFEAVMAEIVADAKAKEPGTLNYQY